MRFAYSISGADVRVVGVPVDGKVYGRKGSENAPDYIREHSRMLEPFVPYLGVDVEGKFEDVGDDVRVTGRYFVAMGGSHVITPPLVKEVAPDAVLFFDAHADFLDDDSHGSVARRIVEMGYDVYHVGTRSGTEEEWGHVNIIALDEAARLSGEVYLSVDLDVFDPGFAPAVSTPEPGGMSPREFFDFLGAFRGKIVAADVVELVPDYDMSGITGILAARIVRDVVGRIIMDRGKDV